MRLWVAAVLLPDWLPDTGHWWSGDHHMMEAGPGLVTAVQPATAMAPGMEHSTPATLHDQILQEQGGCVRRWLSDSEAVPLWRLC